MVDEQFFVGGYAIEKEDRYGLRESSTSAQTLMANELPDRVDPRRSELAAIGWLQTEDQLRQGACQGNSLTECFEFCYPIATGGKVQQFSRQYAYIRSQQFDGIRGDSGSTLMGGTRAALEGICTEEIGPYSSTYPGWDYITGAMKQNAVLHKLRSHVEVTSPTGCSAFLGSGLGCVQVGMLWNDSMTPDQNGCIRTWSARSGGGHAIAIVGYFPDDDIKQRSSSGRWWLLKNSWGKRWGVSGYAYLDEKVVTAIFNHSWTSAYGRSDMETPVPRPLPVDFTKESLLG